MLKQLDEWHKTRTGLLILAIVELGLAYGFGSLAIDRGNPLWYALALIFLVGALQNAFKLSGKLIGKLIHGKHKTN